MTRKYLVDLGEVSFHLSIRPVERAMLRYYDWDCFIDHEPELIMEIFSCYERCLGDILWVKCLSWEKIIEVCDHRFIKCD